jgi:hypothetical protein
MDKTYVLQVDQNSQMDQHSHTKNELPNLNGSNEFGNNSGDVNFHGAEEVVAKYMGLS